MRRFLLFIVAITSFIYTSANEKDNIAKGQINEVSKKTRTIDKLVHTDKTIYQSDITTNNGDWQIEGSWKISKFTNNKLTVGIGFSGSYSSGINDRIISQTIKLPHINTINWEKISLSFDEFYSLESGYDIGYIEISKDGGKNWLILDSRSGTNNEWNTTRIFLDNFSGEEIQLAFRLKTDESFSGQGWFINNLKIDHTTYQYDQEKLQSLRENNQLKSATATLTGTMNSLNSQNFPYIYMNVLLSEDGVGVSNLSKSDFQVYEDGTLVSSYNVVPPDASSGAKLVDIVFLVDNSGSFDDEQNAVRNNMESFVNQLSTSGNDFALGLCRFGQGSSGGYPILEDNGQLTSNIDYFKNTVWLRNVTTGSTEVGYHAIVKSIQGFNFRPGAQKIFIILTDETPDQGGSTKQQATDACLNNYVTLFAMTNNESAALNDIAAATNGRSYDITDPFNDILSDISTSVNNNYLISYKSPNTTMNGVERQVKITATSKTQSTTDIIGSYVPGAAPQITRTAETINYSSKGWDKNTSFDITVVVTDAKEPLVTGVTLYYKHSSNTTYSSVAMTNTSGDNWMGTIPSTISDNPGVDYYITATDGNVTSSLPKVEPNVNPFQIGILPNEKPVISHTSPVTSYSPGQTLTFTATVTDVTNYVASVKLYYRSPGELLYTAIDMTKGSGNDYSCQLTTSTSASGLEYYIVAEDDLGLKSYWSSADIPTEISSGASANFAPYSNPEWNTALVVTTVDGGTSDSPIIYNSEDIFINLSYINNGNTTAGAHYVQLKIDGVVNQTWNVNFDTDPGIFNYLTTHYNIGTLSAGSHTISFMADSNNDVTESDETDNEYSKSITVLSTGTSVANLTPYTPTDLNWTAPQIIATTAGATSTSTTFYDDEDIYLNLCYANLGNGDAAAHTIWIFIDEGTDNADTLSWSNSTGLATMTYYHTTDYNMGKLSAGQHTISMYVDYENVIQETDETDNLRIDTIVVSPRYSPNLKPYIPSSPSAWSNSIVVSKTTGTFTSDTGFTTNDNIYIDGAFENNGTIESAEYYVRIYVDSLYREFQDDEGLNLTSYKYIEDFDAGKLSEGEHTITMFVDCFNDITESDETDNMQTITIEIGSPTRVNMDKLSEEGMMVYPNPCKNYINIEFAKPITSALCIYDLSGRLVMEKAIDNRQKINLSTSQLMNGNYLLQVIDNEKVYNRKIIISK